MTISGFSMVRNADRLYYPIVPAIRSILPIVDEFVIAIGQGDEGDKTRELVAAIDDPKVKIIDTVWDIEAFPNGTENAHQTDIAMNACTGDWLFYLQADEVIHEQYLPIIRQRCEALKDRPEVEGLLFNYRHFWGDYQHYHHSHGWYPQEIRIVRNHPEIHSWESAQSFRKIPDFDGRHYRQQEGTFKLKVARVDAEVFHYGWVRPPRLMQNKKKALDTIHKGQAKADSLYQDKESLFDYGPLQLLPVFNGTHPEVMQDWIARFDWKDQLQYHGKALPDREKFKHERLKYRLLTWVEQRLLGANTSGGFRKYGLLDV
ncbi:MAG: hypothetical protein AAGB22_06615 [Bacteroidota bacterium]